MWSATSIRSAPGVLVGLLAAACSARPASPPAGRPTSSPPAGSDAQGPAPDPLAAWTRRPSECQPAAGGAGVELDGRCLPITVHAGGWGSPVTARLGDDPALRHVADQGCEPDSNLARGDGAVFVHVTCGGMRGAVIGYVMRVDAGGVQSRVAVPAAGGARVSFVAGPRPLVVVVLNSVGTVALDPGTLERQASWERMGGWFNATTEGAAPSPDGAWFAVPDPYGRDIDVVRVADLAVVGWVAVHALTARDEGPGRIEWRADGLEVTTFELPFE